MSIDKIFKITIMILFAFIFTDIALSCPDNTAPTIITPEDGDVVLLGSTVLCQATGDAVITWSGAGSFSPSTGSSVNWTAPSTIDYVTITATNSYGSDQVQVQTADIIYVDLDKTGGNNNGTSWTHAFLDLQDGLAAASAGNHIWVAEGVYKPGTPDTNTFQLEEGVEVYGGFNGTETKFSQRDWVGHETILSGDIDGDDILDSGNSHHVVTCQYADSSTVLDGFTITMGWAHSGLCDGAGMKITSAHPTVSNCTFRDNRAYGSDGDGGGMSCLYSSPTVTNCIFIDNVAGDDGGALVNSKGSNGTFTNCVFYSNNTNGENLEYDDGEWEGKSNGGAIWNTCGENYNVEGSSPKFINCLITENSTVPGVYGGKRGGGAANNGSGTNPVYINCTFTENTAYLDGGGMCTKDSAVATVVNCIFWDNNVGTGCSGVAIYNKDGGATNVSYSDLDQSGYDDPEDKNISQDPNFANPTDPDGPDNRFLTCDDGFRICFDSNCVDAGNGTATNAPATDILDMNRVDIRAVTNTGLGTPYSDMGAYEAVVEHVIFISVDGLAAYYLEPMVTAGNVPKIKRFIEEGLWTYDARPDYRWTKTLPNHVTMVTGRPVEKGSLESDTTHHGYTSNDDPSSTDTLHNTGNTGDPPTGYMYKASPFDIVHDHSMRTSMYAGKSKFVIFWQSYNSDGGREDQVTPPDDGTKKMDIYKCWGDKYDDVYSVTLVNTFMNDASNYNTNFAFLHFKGPDIEGHDHNWDSDEWKTAVVQANNRIGSIFDMVENSSNEEWYYNAVVIMTADHGGINGGHGTPTIRQEYELPFGVWGHLVPKGNAYKYSNGTRSDPVNAQGNDYDIPYNETEQPIRHADGVDLGLSLIGLPAIDGALIKGMQIKFP